MIRRIMQVVLINDMVLARGADEPHRPARLGEQPAAAVDADLLAVPAVEVVVREPYPRALAIPFIPVSMQ